MANEPKQLRAVTDTTRNAKALDVIGSKADAATLVTGTIYSMVAMLKGIMALLGAGGGVWNNGSVGPSDFFAGGVVLLSLTPADVSYLDSLYLDCTGFTLNATITAVINIKVGAGAVAVPVTKQFKRTASDQMFAVVDSVVTLPALAAACTVVMSSDNLLDTAVTVPFSYVMR